MVTTPLNGQMSGNRFEYDKHLQFSCNDGYELVGGSSEITCQADGTWDGTVPICNSEFMLN